MTPLEWFLASVLAMLLSNAHINHSLGTPEEHVAAYMQERCEAGVKEYCHVQRFAHRMAGRPPYGRPLTNTDDHLVDKP